MKNEIRLLDNLANKIKDNVDPQEILGDIEFIRDEKRSEEFVIYMDNVAREHREILSSYKLICESCWKLAGYMELIDEVEEVGVMKNRINRYKRNRVINPKFMQEAADMLLDYADKNIKICARFILAHNEKDDEYYHDVERMKTRFEVIEGLSNKFMVDVLLIPEGARGLFDVHTG